MTEAECRGDSTNWQARGEYDALPQGDPPWIDAYAHYCQRYGVAVDREAYLEGWRIGRAEYERRVTIAN